MKSEELLISKIGKDTGFRVPEGYFETVFTKISNQLPKEVETKPVTISRWHRIRPYIYLAAMFGGIWCTMKMVDMMSGGINTISLDNPPAMVAQAMTKPDYVDNIAMQTSIADADINSDLQGEYSDFDEFVSDFDYDFKTEYADIDIEGMQAESYGKH